MPAVLELAEGSPSLMRPAPSMKKRGQAPLPPGSSWRLSLGCGALPHAAAASGVPGRRAELGAGAGPAAAMAAAAAAT